MPTILLKTAYPESLNGTTSVIFRMFFGPTGNELKRHKSDNSRLKFQSHFYVTLQNGLDQSHSSQKEESELGAQGQKFNMGPCITGYEGVDKRQAGSEEATGDGQRLGSPTALGVRETKEGSGVIQTQKRELKSSTAWMLEASWVGLEP